MIVQTKAEKVKEVEFQTKMLDNLKKWIRNLTIFSSLMVAISYWAFKLNTGLVYNIVGGVSLFFVVVTVLVCVITGLAYKRGKENVDKITSAL